MRTVRKTFVTFSNILIPLSFAAFDRIDTERKSPRGPFRAGLVVLFGTDRCCDSARRSEKLDIDQRESGSCLSDSRVICGAG